MNKEDIISTNTGDFPEYETIRKAILEAKEKVVTTVNAAMVAAYWSIGRQLYDVQSSMDSTYGKNFIRYVSLKLTEEFGKGFDERNLRHMRQFYETYPNWNAVRSELSWTHYRLLIRIPEPEKWQLYNALQ